MLQDILVYIIITAAFTKFVLASLGFIRPERKKSVKTHCPGCTSCEGPTQAKYTFRKIS